MIPGSASNGLAIDDVDVDSVVRRASIERLYADTIPTAIGAALLATVLWLMFFRETRETRVLVWAVLIHACQIGRLALVTVFRRRAERWSDPSIWLRRYRITLLATSAAWGLAPLLFMPSRDLAHTAVMLLVLVGVTVSGLAAVASDRASVYLCILPVMGPVPVALLWRYSSTNLVLALFALLFLVTNLIYALRQNQVLRTILRSQFENAALVKRLNQQIELTAAASKEKSRFLAAASHDLRQPLHALSFFGSTLERRMANSPDRPLIYNMMRSIEALDKSFNAILDVSKLDAQAVEPHLQLFPLRDVFRRLQMSFGGQAEEAGLQLRFKPGGRVVKSDPQLLERTLANLVQNALRYCNSGGVVVVARDWNGGTNIEVWDTGIGIPADELPKIFGEFYQVANPERDRNKGLGIGLAIVSRLTQLLEHTLTVKSRVGKGSLFRIWVPGSDLQRMDEFTVGSDTVPASIDEALTILFIDDEEAIRISVSDLLRQWGYSVLAAATVEGARHALRMHGKAIDVLISDLRLRGGDDGIRAIEEIRQVCGHMVPAILITGDTAPDQVQRIHASGHIALFKPVDPKDLFMVLKRITT